MSPLIALLWLQTAYSIWQFVRNAKFLRLPYIFIYNITIRLSIHKALPTSKTVYFAGCPSYFIGDAQQVLVDDRIKINDIVSELALQGVEIVFSKEDSTNSAGRKCLIRYKNMVINSSELFLRHLKLVFEGRIIVKNEFDMLTPNCFIFKEKSMKEIFKEQPTLYMFRAKSFIDTTGDEQLNQNFFRLISIAPLVLQLKGHELASLFLSLFIIFVDMFSSYFNLLWSYVKDFLIEKIKWIISFFNVSKRVYMHHFLSTISIRFLYCDEDLKKSYYVNKDTILYSSKFSKCKDKDNVSIIDLNLESTDWATNCGYSFRVNERSVFVEVTDGEHDRFNLIVRYGSLTNTSLESKYGVNSVLTRLNYIQSLGENCFVVSTLHENNLHIDNEMGFMGMLDSFDTILKAKERRRFFVSDYTIQQLIAFSRIKKVSGEDRHSALFIEHFREFFGSIDNIGILGDLFITKNASYRPPSVGNSQWKRYVSDINFILCKFNIKMLIYYCNVKKPSQALLKAIDRVSNNDFKTEIEYLELEESYPTLSLGKSPVSLLPKIWAPLKTKSKGKRDPAVKILKRAFDIEVAMGEIPELKGEVTYKKALLKGCNNPLTPQFIHDLKSRIASLGEEKNLKVRRRAELMEEMDNMRNKTSMIERRMHELKNKIGLKKQRQKEEKIKSGSPWPREEKDLDVFRSEGMKSLYQRYHKKFNKKINKGFLNTIKEDICFELRIRGIEVDNPFEVLQCSVDNTRISSLEESLRRNLETASSSEEVVKSEEEVEAERLEAELREIKLKGDLLVKASEGEIKEIGVDLSLRNKKIYKDPLFKEKWIKDSLKNGYNLKAAIKNIVNFNEEMYVYELERKISKNKGKNKGGQKSDKALEKRKKSILSKKEGSRGENDLFELKLISELVEGGGDGGNSEVDVEKKIRKKKVNLVKRVFRDSFFLNALKPENKFMNFTDKHSLRSAKDFALFLKRYVNLVKEKRESQGKDIVGTYSITSKEMRAKTPSQIAEMTVILELENALRTGKGNKGLKGMLKSMIVRGLPYRGDKEWRKSVVNVLLNICDEMGIDKDRNTLDLDEIAGILDLLMKREDVMRPDCIVVPKDKLTWGYNFIKLNCITDGYVEEEFIEIYKLMKEVF